ncbi:DUF6629 family protein [Methylobacterium sp. WSM2598]|uniref:DUF6629 family protein n=1 Tax=Methylobacterium sp. WSM2598 TaxID=398261 RepID=UPI001F2FC75C|nr:DUF6629 family protein [Methylobacterium sp. WSM2598]
MITAINRNQCQLGGSREHGARCTAEAALRMCFSATASFTAGAALISLGAVTLARAQAWRQVPLAAIPLAFGLQQWVEGALWLRLETQTGGLITAALTHAFLAFAEVIWPVLIPISASLAEVDFRRRRFISLFIPYGLAVAAYLLFGMISSPYRANVLGHSIFYHSDFSRIAGIEYIYLAGISIPLLLSSHRMIIMMGLVNVLILIGSKYFYPLTYISVWCFFAAVASILIYQHFRAIATARSRRPSGSQAATRDRVTHRS